MAMYSYVLAVDDGAAPNPYYGYCTLSICKPRIRMAAKIGDWIVGTGNKQIGNNKVVYAMKVGEILSFSEYFNDKRFSQKKPDLTGRDDYAHLGDNIYEPLADDFKQLTSVHSNGVEEDATSKSHDLSGKNVLISSEFYYFGNNAIALPENLHSSLKNGRGHKSKSITFQTIQYFEAFMQTQQAGIQGSPSLKLSKEDILDTGCVKSAFCCEDEEGEI